MRITQINNSNPSFTSVYRIPYTKEGMELLARNLVSSEVSKKAKDKVLESVLHRDSNPFGFKIIPNPLPIDTPTKLLAFGSPQVLKDGKSDNYIRTLVDRYPQAWQAHEVIKKMLYCGVTRSDAKSLGIKYAKDYTIDVANNLIPKRLERLKELDIDLAKFEEKYIYVFSGRDFFDYVEQYVLDLNPCRIKTITEGQSNAKNSFIKNLAQRIKETCNNVLDRLEIKSNFYEDSDEPIWLKTMKNYIEMDKIQQEKFNNFLAKRNVVPENDINSLIKHIKTEG